MCLRLGDSGTDRWRSDPPCVYPPAKAGHIAKRRVGLEYSPSMLEPMRPGAVSPDRALCDLLKKIPSVLREH
jgi:hypothetical protein